MSLERLFSGAGELYDDKRSRLMPQLVKSLLLIKYNFPLVEGLLTTIDFFEEGMYSVVLLYRNTAQPIIDV